MSRTHVPIAGTGTGDAYQANDRWGYQTAEKVRNDLALGALAVYQRNVSLGGDEVVAIGVGSGTGWITIIDAHEWEIDNSNGSQASSAANFVGQVRVKVRVENAGISVTPRVFNLTDASVPSQSGAAACSAILDTFAGANQDQTITFTPAAGKKLYVVQIQKSADTYAAWAAKAQGDCFIDG